jgi:hypothetical protein
MHSYASGDAVAIPLFVYPVVIVLTGLCVAAYLKYSKLGKDTVEK